MAGKVPVLISHLIEMAIAHHYTKCKRSHGDNAGWFECEAASVGSVPVLVAAFELVDAAERWRIGMRMETPGPLDQRLIEAVELFRDVVSPVSTP